MNKLPFRASSLGILFLALLTNNLSLYAETSDSLVYVWDFATREHKKNELTINLTKEFEEALIQSGCFLVLERRDYDRLIAQKDNEKAILGIENISTTTLESLKSHQASAMLFGEVYDDIESGEIKVTITFQRFDGIKRVWSIRFLRKKRIDAESREEAMQELAGKICNDPSLRSQKTYGQHNRIDSQLMTLAVAEFRTQGIPTEQQWLGKDFPDALISEFSKARSIRVVEREYLEDILSELKLQSSSYIDSKSAVEIGHLLGTHNFVFGSVSFLGNNVLVRARIVNVERAEIIGTADATGSQDDIRKIQGDFARQIASKMTIEATLAEASRSEPAKMKLSVYQDLDRLQQSARDLPFFGFDPARLRKEGDYRFALSICDNILANYPKLTEAHYYRALFSLHSNNLQNAQQESEIVQRLNSNHLENFLLRGNLLYLMKDFTGAVNAFHEATQKFPDDARGWYGRARLAIANDDKVGAITAYIETLERAPIIPEAETNLQTLIGGSDGLNVLTQMKSQRPAIYPAAMVFRAFWKNELKNLEGIVEQTINQFPRLYIGHYMRGLLEEARENYEKAEIFFKTCLSLRPSFPDVHRSLGVMYLRKGRCAEGRQHVTLYRSTTSFQNDYNEIEQYIRRCEEKNNGK